MAAVNQLMRMFVRQNCLIRQLSRLPTSGPSPLPHLCFPTHCLRCSLHTGACRQQSGEVRAVRAGVNAVQSSSEVALTDRCVQQIKKVVEGGSRLRVVVESGGCSGFQYKFEIDSNVNEDDRVFEKNGATVIIDCDSLELLRGSVIDFKTELIRSAFTVSSNPLAENGCSCGASFNVKI